MAYSGKYTPKNPAKYEDDHTNIVYRSSWELSLMKWLDMNPDVVSWSSESVVIPYISPIDDRPHRYFVDFKVKFKNGKVLLIEVKPDHQTKKPVAKKGKRKSVILNEAHTYGVNWAKWKAAERFAEERGWKFAVFTEHTLGSLGIRIPSTAKKVRR